MPLEYQQILGKREKAEPYPRLRITKGDSADLSGLLASSQRC